MPQPFSWKGVYRNERSRDNKVFKYEEPWCQGHTQEILRYSSILFPLTQLYSPAANSSHHISSIASRIK